MPPPIAMDTSSDFAMHTKTPLPLRGKRTLLLSPPSLSSHQEKLTTILEMHDRSATDMQMLDRLSLGLVSLPSSIYDAIIVLSDADGTRTESRDLLSREVMELLVKALKVGGSLRSHDGQLGRTDGREKNEAILTGLVSDQKDGFVKPDIATQSSVPLKLNRKKAVAHAAGSMNGHTGTDTGTGTGTDTVSLPPNGKRKSQDKNKSVPAGVGFDEGTNGAASIDSDSDLIDEDDLLSDSDLAKHPSTIKVPRECAPKAKRRRACKDCTCGLAQKLESEDKAKRENADHALKLNSDDLAEVDFTAKGKVGSCGSCSLGDAFRCDGCPYIGLPAFKPGEEVRLLNDDIQL